MFQLRKYTILEILAHFEFDVATRLKSWDRLCGSVLWPLFFSIQSLNVQGLGRAAAGPLVLFFSDS